MTSTGTMQELCGDSTLKNLVIMIYRWKEGSHTGEEMLQSQLSDPSGFVQEVVRRGAKIYRCTGAFEPDLGAVRTILGDRSVAELLRELEEQKGRAQQEADVFKKRIAEMESKEGSIRQDVSREVEEQKRKAQEEADGFRKCIAEMRSKLEDDRRGFGKTSATYNLRHLPANLRVFFVRSLTHLALQRIYPSTDLHPNSPIVSTTHFTAKNTNNVCEICRRMTSSGSLTIWTRYVTMSPSLTGCSSWLVDSQTRSFGSRFSKVFARTQKRMCGSHHTSNTLYDSSPPSYR